jgi:hypothetical protein
MWALDGWEVGLGETPPERKILHFNEQLVTAEVSTLVIGLWESVQRWARGCRTLGQTHITPHVGHATPSCQRFSAPRSVHGFGGLDGAAGGGGSRRGGRPRHDEVQEDRMRDADIRQAWRRAARARIARERGSRLFKAIGWILSRRRFLLLFSCSLACADHVRECKVPPRSGTASTGRGIWGVPCGGPRHSVHAGSLWKISCGKYVMSVLAPECTGFRDALHSLPPTHSFPQT